ncbi:MAG TPA: single-stranded DNA-binding protein [Thermomicrobiales bacterium]|nr:single-stranded DNA-binding protein [Thermomicrobiales bacterium]
MSQSYNQILLVGRLGRDPEVRQTAGGQAVARFSLATTRPARARTTPETDWHDIVCWEAQAEFAERYLTRGRLVLVVGALHYRAWTGKDGQPRRGAEIRAARLVPLDSRPETSPAVPPAPSRDEARGHDDPDEGDVPF